MLRCSIATGPVTLRSPAGGCGDSAAGSDLGGVIGIAGSARRQCGHGHTGDREGIDATSAGMGVQAIGQVPHASDAGMGVQAIGQVPHASDAGRGVQAIGQVPHASDAGRGDALLTSAGRTAWRWLHQLADRLERVRVVHGDWSRCLNNHFGGSDTAVFLDPPYRSYEKLYGNAAPVADQVEAWARKNADLRVALCGHRGDYDLPGWDAVDWDRGRLTYSGGKTTDQECIWYSPACLPRRQIDLFAAADPQDQRTVDLFQRWMQHDRASLIVPQSFRAVIAPLCVKSHDQRALDATLRDRFRYLLRIARLLGTDSAAIENEIISRKHAIAYEYHCKLGRA